MFRGMVKELMFPKECEAMLRRILHQIQKSRARTWPKSLRCFRILAQNTSFSHYFSRPKFIGTSDFLRKPYKMLGALRNQLWTIILFSRDRNIHIYLMLQITEK